VSRPIRCHCYKANFKVNAKVNTKVNAHVMRAASQGNRIRWRWPAVALVLRQGVAVCRDTAARAWK
jgi:hypothetical protein